MPYRILSTGSRTAKPCRSIPNHCRFLVWYSGHMDASVWTPQHCSILKLIFSFNITRSKILYLFEQEEPLVIEIRLHRGLNAISSFFSVGQDPLTGLLLNAGWVLSVKVLSIYPSQSNSRVRWISAMPIQCWPFPSLSAVVCADSRSLGSAGLRSWILNSLTVRSEKQPNTNIKESAFKGKRQAVADFQTHTSTATLVGWSFDQP